MGRINRKKIGNVEKFNNKCLVEFVRKSPKPAPFDILLAYAVVSEGTGKKRDKGFPYFSENEKLEIQSELVVKACEDLPKLKKFLEESINGKIIASVTNFCDFLRDIEIYLDTNSENDDDLYRVIDELKEKLKA